MGSRVTFRAHSCGWSQFTSGAETTAVFQGPDTKCKKSWDLSLHLYKPWCLHPTTGLVNSAPTEHLHGNEALSVKTSLALATVDVVGTHMRHVGQVTVYIAP